MQKNDFTNIIKKYYLDGLVPNARWTIKDKTLSVGKKSFDASVLVQLDANLDIEDGEIGVFDAGNLLTILGALDSEVNVEYQFHQNVPTGLVLNDKVSNATFLLGDTSLDEFDVHSLKTNLPEFQVKINLKKDLIDRFIKGRSALKDSKIVAFEVKNGSTDVIINYDPNHGSNRITIPFTSESSQILDICGFNIDPIQKAFSANLDFKTGTISISDRGLMEIHFLGEDYDVKYYLNKLQFD